MSLIEDASTGRSARVDSNNRLETQAISESLADAAANKGDRFNINTGTVTLTSASESAVLYIKNNEELFLTVTEEKGESKICIMRHKK